MKRTFLSILMTVLSVLCFGAEVSVTGLKAEQMENPMGIDTATPQLGWRIVSDARNVSQIGYRILAASSPEILAGDEGDLWDSGMVYSSQSQWILYKGKKLADNTRVWWKVKSYTNVGETQWSEPALFSVGVHDQLMWWGMTQWIGMERKSPWEGDPTEDRLSARYLRKEFKIAGSVKQATLYISGLGLYEAYINGERIGDSVLSPSPTDYRKTILYNTYDVTSQLSENNAIGVVLGNGNFYAMRQESKQYHAFGWINFGYPKLRMMLIIEYEDGREEKVVSDASWKMTADGPIRANNEYDGEEYDARRELGTRDGSEYDSAAWTKSGYDESTWKDVEIVADPGGMMRGTTSPGMKVVSRIEPVSVTPIGDSYIIDMGQNFTGWLRFKIKGLAGDTITIRYAELLDESGKLYTENLRTAKATDRYVCNGDEAGTTWAPAFSFHGFRYAEVSGYPDPQISDFTGEVISDAMEVTGSFECSNPTLNHVYRNCFWGILSNYKGFPLDCPQRDEREPWLGDRDAGCWGESYIFGNGAFYTKWTLDIMDSQRGDGSVPCVAPAFWPVYLDDVTWPYAFPSVCDMLYTRYGNSQIIEKTYPSIKRWFEHVCSEYLGEDFIYTWDMYGDWCVPPESPELIHSMDPGRVTDGSLLSTAYIVKICQLMQRFASILDIREDISRYAEMEKNVAEAFNVRFLKINGTEAHYDNNTVTANILPLAFGIVPHEYVDSVTDSIVKVIMDVNGGHVSCGVIGIQWLMKELSRRGHADIAWLLATNTTYPSWGYMAENGATTIWELWNGNTADPSMNSGNHVMLIGDLISWCYENIGGIQPDYNVGETGYTRIILAPEFGIEGCDWANVSYDSVYGLIESNWKKGKKSLDSLLSTKKWTVKN